MHAHRTVYAAAAALVLLFASTGFCLDPVVVLSASSVESAGLGVTNILDGNTDTRWSSAHADGQWVIVDFRNPVQFDAVSIFWEQAFASNFALQVSNDGSSWSEVYSTSSCTGGLVEISFTAETKRYLKIDCVKRGTEWGFSIKEATICCTGQSVIAENWLVEEQYKIHVDVNQAFYAPSLRKTAILWAMDAPLWLSYAVKDAGDNTVASGSPTYRCYNWNRNYWTLDFSSVTSPGTYRVCVTSSSNTYAEAQVFINLTNILAAMDKTLFYFMTQRCGTNIPDWHQACHLDDGTLPDGSHHDAAGGWHDCEAFDKELYTAWLPVYFFSTIAAESENPWRDRMIGEARWGADWIMKMVDTNGYTWCHVESGYVADEAMDAVWSSGTPTDNIWSNGDDRGITTNAWGIEEPSQAFCAGALARLGDVLRDEDPAYSRQCFQKAGQIIRWLMQREDQTGVNFANDTSPYLDYHGGRLLADIYLYGTDPDIDYYADARRRIHIIANYFRRPDGDMKGASDKADSCSTELYRPYAFLMFMYDFAKRAPDDPAVETIKTVFRDFVENHAAQRTDPTPYGEAQIVVTNDQRNFAWPEPGNSVSQGRNCYWLSLATVFFMADDLLGTNAYSGIAAGQLDWVLGKNPFGVSTVADVGYRFPRMRTKWAFMVDHPGEDGVIPGGAVNGIGGNSADEPAMDMDDEKKPDWWTNEYWNPPTAWFAMACWRYYRRAVDLEHTPSYELYYAYLAHVAPRRPCLIRNFTEGEHYLRQIGSDGLDYKPAASGGQVLGMGWGEDNDNYVDYESFVTGPLVDPVLHARYACGAYTGRSFDVQWDNVHQSTLSCTNTGGWGDSASEFSWASASLSSLPAGIGKLTLLAQGTVSPVNIDCWYFTDGQSCCRECEDYDAQTGSGGQDLKAGASQEEVLGDGWGISPASEAIYSNITAGVQTGAWLHVWYACGVSSGRVLNAYLDGELRARLVCPCTGGWGDETDDFNIVSTCIGGMDGSSHVLKFTVPGAGDGVNLDCFCLGTPAPELLPWDADQDGLSDAQEDVSGTSSAAQDSDGDGIADGDEVQFGWFGQVSDPGRADTDGDQFNDMEEAVSGTDPWDGNDLFVVSDTDVAGSGEFVLTWPGKSGRLYTVLRCSDLLAPPFTNLAVDLPATPPLNCYTATVDSGVSFYRLRVRRP